MKTFEQFINEASSLKLDDKVKWMDKNSGRKTGIIIEINGDYADIKSDGKVYHDVKLSSCYLAQNPIC